MWYDFMVLPEPYALRNLALDLASLLYKEGYISTTDYFLFLISFLK
jgi:hypothetical protein